MKGKRQKVKGKIRMGRLIGFFFLLPLYFLLPSPPAMAQDGPEDAAPPPLKVFSKEERDRLGSQLDLKDRTKLALELMGSRLKEAERLAAAGDNAAMYTELGGFHALMDHIMEHVDKLDERRSKVLDAYKRIEIGLRNYTPRLENLRRDVPLKYEHYVRKLIKYLRDTRARALEPMFGNTVVRNNDPKPGKKP